MFQFDFNVKAVCLFLLSSKGFEEVWYYQKVYLADQHELSARKPTPGMGLGNPGLA